MFNIQPGNSSGRRVIRKSSSDNGQGVDALCGLCARVFQTALILLVIGAFFHTYIKLDNEIDRAALEIRKVNEKIAAVERNIDGLKGRYAICSSRQFIIRQIARFNLPLAPIRHDQRQEIRLYSNKQLANLRYPLFRSVPPVAMDIRRQVSSRMRVR